MSNSSDDDSSVVSSSSDSTSASPRNNKRPRIQQAPLQNAAAAEKPLGIEDKKKRVIVLLDQARLETVKTKKGDFQLLNCDDHRDLCRKYKKNPADYRPDICHQELLSLLDSPLNKAGCLQVYIKTDKKVLIEVSPNIRIPRTYKRFSGLMVQLLHKLKIKAAGDGGKVLLKVIKNPFSQYLPAGAHVYGMSCKGTLYAPSALATNLIPDDGNQVCFIIGAMATGHITIEDHPYIEKMMSISEYPLSGASAINRILGAIEAHWGIV